MMARTIQTARHDHQALVEAPVANPATSLPTITSRLHTEFMEVKVHTAICDSCDKHNKQTLYRCIKCSLHICSLCWNKKSGDGTHVFGGGLCNVPDVNVDFVIENGDTGGREGNESEDRKHARRRVHVISDDEDDDVSVLKPAPTTKNPEAIEAREQQKKTLNVTMNNDHHEGQENDLPRLWPIVPARRLPVLRPAVPAADMSATESANQATQINPHIHGEESDPERQRIVRVCDHLGRQLISSQYAFAGDQETKHQARSLTQSSISNQQANHYAHLHAQPTTYRQRPGTDVDQQAARNQHAFANNQPTDRQAPCLPQRLIAPQQAVHFTPCQNPHAIFRPRPGVDVDLQAARNQLAFANPPRVDHQAPRSGQASVSQQQVFHPAQSSISYQHAMDEVTARRQQASRLNQQAQAYANAKQMEAGNQQALSSHQVARPAGNRDQVAAHNQQAFISNHQSSSAARYAEQMVAARDQQAYLSRQQADCPIPGPAQTLASHRHATNPLPFPTQAFLSQQHAALQASRQAEHRRATEDRLNRPSGDTQAREHSAELLEAADALLLYAGVEQIPGVRFRSDQDANGVSQSLSTAGQLDRASSFNPESRSSSKVPSDGSGAAGTRPNAPLGTVLDPSPRSTDTDSARARLDRHHALLASMHSPSSTRGTVSDLPARLRGHPTYRHAALQPEPRPAPADSPTAQSHGSSFGGAQSPPGPRLQMSDHAAAYLNQWNSGRAALSSRSNSTAVNTPSPRFDQPRSAAPALHPRPTQSAQNLTARKIEPREAAEASTQALTAPITPLEGPNDVDVVMGGPDVETIEEAESRHSETWSPQNNPWTFGRERRAEEARATAPEPPLHADGRAGKHQRGEKQGDDKKGKEHKGSGDVDVADARMRGTKEEHSGDSDDDASDIQITSWNKLDGNKMTDQHERTNAGAKGPESGRTFKKGVAHVKKPKPKGQKGKTTAT